MDSADYLKGEKRMLDVKEAARTAAEYFATLYDPKTYSDLQLEEVELTEDQKYWLITLSYASTNATQTQFGALLNLPVSRKYKQFKIDAETGQVQAMVIRKVG
ncbi:MAG TPA: hypothetical protein VNI02_17260 [Blastocatellia bacterium]|jgi:hypothetical protein|nr:hypothetical protein [Blastocatellia bacterium]